MSDARDRILDATLELIADEGLLGVTNRSLAARAKVSLGSLTYHFESQEELLAESLLRFVEGEAKRLGAIAERLQAEPDAEASAREVQELLSRESERRLAKLELYLYAARRPALHDAARRCFAAYDEVVRAALAALGVEAPAVATPAAVALIDGLQVRRLATGASDELPAADALTLLLRGIQGGGEPPG